MAHALPREVVAEALVFAQERGTAAAAGKYGVSTQTVYGWRRRAKARGNGAAHPTNGTGDGHALTPDEDDEQLGERARAAMKRSVETIEAMRAEIAALRAQNEALTETLKPVMQAALRQIASLVQGPTQ